MCSLSFTCPLVGDWVLVIVAFPVRALKHQLPQMTRASLQHRDTEALGAPREVSVLCRQSGGPVSQIAVCRVY